ncbi:hypothetical protein CHS0354_024550 [Potamilus streckersoni]|uniref:Uncharacterized protein n=1 Tax=Potamilus streckersoni TaxID=2493646 RepID=A0AAE0TQ55_9BIVA|nr:hypothetical protein CHS0354_024550 [Potamilus streckersoni]
MGRQVLDWLPLTQSCTNSCIAIVGGAVDLFTESQEPTRLTSFQELIYALQMGEIVHFSSMIFLCQGSGPHPFEILGGTIRGE